MKRKNFKMFKCSLILAFAFCGLNFFNIANGQKIEPRTTLTNEENITENTNSKDAESITQGIFDIKVVDNVYKESEKNTYLPFIRYATDRILVDKDVNNMGLMFSGKSIDITSKINAPQIILSNDTVRISNSIKDMLIVTTSNVVIDSIVDGNLIIYSGGNITISKNANITGDVIVYASNTIIDGKVLGSVLGTSPKIEVNGIIQKDLRVATNEIKAAQPNIIGNVYINTYDTKMNLKDTFPNATLNIIKETKKSTFNINMLLDAILISLLFTAMYALVNKISKGKVFDKALEKCKKYPFFAILSGTLLLMMLPFVILLLLFLCIFKLSIIAIPALFVYIAFLIVTGMLSTFVVGSVIANYMQNTHFNKLGNSSKYVATFILFITLYILARVPYIGGYISMLLVMLSVGIAFTYIFKKIK
ncbi:MAG: polymer-forming cytoskeletal protein [Clostridia bacterium]